MSTTTIRDGRLLVAAHPHRWPVGEKDFFARRNDFRSMDLALSVARARRVPDPDQIEQLTRLRAEKLQALQQVEQRHGFARDHETVADPVIAADREVIRDELLGLGALRRSVESLRVSLETAKRRAGVTTADGAPKYPNDVMILERLMVQYDAAVAALDAKRPA